jgi:hypothetical protein
MLLEEIKEKVVLLSPSDRLALMQVIVASLQENKATNNDDYLAKVRQSKFIGCFEGDPDLSTNSEDVISKEIAKIAMLGGAFKFLETEPDIYTLDDGQPV